MAQPQKLADIVTVVTNISGSSKMFTFLPPHGVVLADGASVTVQGDLFAQLNTGTARRRRKYNALVRAATKTTPDLLVSVQSRDIFYGKVNNTTVIATGDMVFFNSGDGSIKAAADFTWDTNLATTQAAFKAVFLGIALSAHANGGGAITNFPVDMSGSVRRLTCNSETHNVGDTLGPAKASGNALLSNKLVKAAGSASIARSMSYDASAATVVAVSFVSAYKTV